MKKLSLETVQKLTKVGWYNNRNIEDEVLQWEMSIKSFGFHIGEKWHQILSEFGGISLQPYSDWFYPVIFMPTQDAMYEYEIIKDVELYLKTTLSPLGHTSDGYFWICCDMVGKIYFIGGVDGNHLFIVGESIQDFLNKNAISKSHFYLKIADHKELVFF